MRPPRDPHLAPAQRPFEVLDLGRAHVLTDGHLGPLSAVLAPRKPKCPKTNSAASRILASISGPGAGLRPPLDVCRSRNAFRPSDGMQPIALHFNLRRRDRRRGAGSCTIRSIGRNRGHHEVVSRMFQRVGQIRSAEDPFTGHAEVRTMGRGSSVACRLEQGRTAS